MKRGTPRSTRTETLFPDTTLIVSPGQDAVRIADGSAVEGDALPAGVRVFGPDVAAPDQGDAPLESNRVSRNLEPEFIALDGGTAYAALQEANAVAEVDLATATVTGIRPLGDRKSPRLNSSH